MVDQSKLSGETRQVTRAAALISIGNIISRALGLIRDMAQSYFFGAGGAVSAFNIASQVPTMLYDQLVGGMLNSSLVPVFSDYASDNDADGLWHLLSNMLSVVSIFLGAVVVLLEFFAPWVARALGKGLPPEFLELATQMIRITAPAVFFLNIAGLLSAALYGLRRFTLPAFTAAIYNATVLVVIVLFGRGALGTRTLAVGLLAATMTQTLFQLPGLRGIQLRFRSPFPLHPAWVQIARLYLPIGLGLLVDLFAGVLSYNIASRTGESGISWMKYAATLIQFPLGLVVTAVSVAILPTLSRYATDDNEEAFRLTLAQGMRLVLVLVLPAAVGLLILAEPLVALLFQRGEFMPSDTIATASALRFSILGLIFAALDQPLVFSFYARKDTWTPALVGVVTVIAYIFMALIPTYYHPPRLWELILVNSLKLTLHAILMLVLFNRRIGSLKPYHVWRTAWIALAASGVMALPLVGILRLLRDIGSSGSLGYLIRIFVASGVGGAVYLLILRLMHVHDIALVGKALRNSESSKS
ncbi:MAG: murein biosynthesis integral membrane protein MurJ [Anaerolineales bacterium]|nr:MAG: murein biosynthesis integral membrane protein MurJ [Anaerolineales bacterium]